MKRVLWMVMFSAFLCTSVFAEEQGKTQNPGNPVAKEEHAEHKANPSATVSSSTVTPGSQPPGLKKQGKTPPGLKKQGKTPKGWSQGKKTGWDSSHPTTSTHSGSGHGHH